MQHFITKYCWKNKSVSNCPLVHKFQEIQMRHGHFFLKDRLTKMSTANTSNRKLKEVNRNLVPLMDRQLTGGN